MQCFIDAIVAESENGNQDADELIELLTKDIDDNQDDATFNHEIERTTKLFLNVVAGGNVLSERAMGNVYAMMGNDIRIVWTNDRINDAGESAAPYLYYSTSCYFPNSLLLIVLCCVG